MFEDLKNTLLNGKEEKKVEYLELIYDLIFVYIIGRNSSLVHHIENGFIDPDLFFTYVLCTLIVIQIWNYTNFYVNRFGSNGLQEHLLILVNMYLLYFMADSTRLNWHDYYYRYNIAWALILLNLFINYYIEYRRSMRTKPWEIFQIKSTLLMLGIQIAVIVISLPVFSKTGLPLSPLAMVFGIAYTVVTSKINDLLPVDFGHLSERAMLYIVFTFGEMIIAISGYFEGDFGFETVYFSLMGFLIVVGLFQSYEVFYDHLIDREMITSGTSYMTVHLFLIFSLNNITMALEFMREPEVDLFAKTVFLAGSFVVYYVFLYLLGLFTKAKARPTAKFIAIVAAILIMFAILMVILRTNMYVNIALTVILVFGNLFNILRAKKTYVKACAVCKEQP